MLLRLALTTALSASALLLSACGGLSSGSDAPASGHVDTSPPTPRQKSQTPEQFIRTFVAVSNRMEARGGTSRFLRLTSQCTTCVAVADQISDARSAGGYFRSRGWRIRRLAVSRGKKVTAALTVVSAPTSYQPTGHAGVQHYAGGLLAFRIGLIRNAGRWLVTELVEVAQ